MSKPEGTVETPLTEDYIFHESKYGKINLCQPYPIKLKMHNISNGGLKSIICDICGEQFSHRNSITYHIRSKHSERRTYCCNKCGKGFISTCLLKKHFRRKHTILKLFECVNCHAAFAGKDDLEVHVGSCKQSGIHCEKYSKSVEHERPHKCKKVDTEKKQIKEYRCNICPKTFPYSSNLSRHLKLHSSERPYQCEQCDRRFPTNSRLKMHENEHKKEYTFKCETCQKTFVNKRVLQIHNRRHTRTFPFQCEVCKKSFPEKFTLVKHSRIHTGERPFRCDVCNRAFSDKSNFVRHKKKLHLLTVSGSNDFSPKSSQKSSPVASELEDTQENVQKPRGIYNSRGLNNILGSQVNKCSENKNGFLRKKCLTAENNTNPFLLIEPELGKNLLLLPQLLTESPLKNVAGYGLLQSTFSEETYSSPLVLKSVRRQNSYFIVSKPNSQKLPSNKNLSIMSDVGDRKEAKVFVIRNTNLSKPKIIMQRPLKNKCVKNEVSNDKGVKDNCEADNDQDKLPELYAYEELPPSPVSSECIDVEDLVATFTPNISFEEIGDLKDLVNAEIDL